MIVLITGGRNYQDHLELVKVLDQLHAERRFTFLVHGNAKGADKMAHKWALWRGVQPVAMEALWDFCGDKAGTKRNTAMLQFAQPNLVVAFSGGVGTANMMKQSYDAQKKGMEIEIIDVEDTFP